jgi:hypothetical protein
MAANGWPSRARRVRPPEPYKDWTEAKAGGVDLRLWWAELIAGADRPTLSATIIQEERRGNAEDAKEPAIPGPQRGDSEVQTSAPKVRRRRAAKAVENGHPQPALGDELHLLLQSLNRRGIRLDGQVVHPVIAVGTVTGRVTYRKPALQTLPKADRTRRITPVIEGQVFVRADYGQIEPRILHEVLRRRGLIDWSVGEDLYRDLIQDTDVNRDLVKRMVNKMINGGYPDLLMTGRLLEFAKATNRYRRTLSSEASKKGYVETLLGRRIPLDRGVRNHRGRAVNRVVQGTAADVFHKAAASVHGKIADGGLPAAVAFLLYDEMWVETDQPDEVRRLIKGQMEEAAKSVGVLIPVRFE